MQQQKKLNYYLHRQVWRALINLLHVEYSKNNNQQRQIHVDVLETAWICLDKRHDNYLIYI